ncbi:MAG: aldehyde dehydrogenase family protein [Rubripirellula sp.]
MSNEFFSESPIDGEILWRGESTSPLEVQERMSRAHKACMAWRGTSVVERMEIVRRYGEELKQSRDAIASLISREVGKLSWDAAGEVSASIAKVELSIESLQQRRSKLTLDTDPEKAGAAIRHIRYQPLGVALVLGPFNFPLHLPGGQIIPALLAGNAVVFKPSEQATAVGEWMVAAWKRAGLPDDVLQIIPGGITTATAAIDAAEVSAVFLTGGRTAGQAIHRQLAGRPEVLLALELGGNNPIVVMDDVGPDAVGRLVSFSSFISSGQRCTCARRALFVEGKQTEQQIASLIEQTRSLRVAMPDATPAPQIGPVISTHAAKTLDATYQQLITLGCQPLIPFHSDTEHPQLVRPAIVDASGVDQAAFSRIGSQEWFGPILVIARVSGFDAAVSAAANTPYGLSASLLGGSHGQFERFVHEVQAGVVNWNAPTTGAAGTLPFGGLGDSGNHRPAGFFAVDFCNDPVASIEYSEPIATNPWDVAK